MERDTNAGVKIGLQAGSSCWVNLESGEEKDVIDK